MAVAWKPLLSLILVSALIIHDEWVSSPSCETLIPPEPVSESESAVDRSEQDLRVMMVANLLLMGSESGYVTRIFRDYYTSKFFSKSFQKLDPDMLVVMGDVSARGSELTKVKWLSVVRQFRGLIGPFGGLPVHTALGDRDIGLCGELGAESVEWIAGRFAGLDAAGCSAFEIGNVSFVSLNSVALLCANDDLRFDVEKVVERESHELRMEKRQETVGEMRGIERRDNQVSPASGPVVLLHFPLHRPQLLSSNLGSDSKASYRRSVAGHEPYGSMQSLPANVTQYILQALKPRIVFSGHNREFSMYTHPDGTYEVAVPASSWNTRDDPAFIVAIFQTNKRAVSIIYCAFSRESRVIIAYVSFLILVVSIYVIMKIHELLCSRRL